MAACEDYCIVFGAVVEGFKGPVVVTVIDYSFEYKFILSKGACFVEGYYVGFAS